MTSGISIVGIGETPPARRSHASLRSMVVDAVLAAIQDAGLTPADVDGIMSDSIIMPVTVPHDYVAGQLGITRTYDATISYGGAAMMCAPLLAAQASSAGAVTVSSVEMSLANSQKYYLVVDGKPAYQTSVHPPRPPSRSMAPRTITFPVTGAWTTYQQLAISTSLNSGSVNTVRIGSAGEDAGNIDEIEVR